MKKLGIVVLCCILSSCAFVKVNGESWGGKRVVGSGSIVEKEYTVEAFDAVSVSVPADIYYSYSEDAPAVKVVAYENLHSFITVNVKGSSLEIKTEKNVSLVSEEDIRIYVNSDKLRKVSLSGSGDFENLSPVSGDSFEISIAGSGDAELKNFNVGTFSTSIAGSGDIDIENVTAKFFSTSIAGSGDLEAEDIDVEKIAASIAGSGDIKLSGKAAEGSFSVAGSGDIYINNLAIDHYDMKTSGSGSIHK